ncbi:pilus assembly PilX family protein [Hydrogenophaga palleronii]|uniref:pilus assembly PilX family protein n=1 Tax=Hydrogenophaga palleronii TaxID=65655 RepID=UPI000AC8A609|nr:hypothetical protein [Hydrogenophaga palleronii]
MRTRPHHRQAVQPDMMGMQKPFTKNVRREHGVVLPMALIMLVIISLAGLLAARNAATHEQFSNNMRTTQVARQSAEAALRYCEAVVIDITSDEGVLYGSLESRIVSAELDPDNLAAGAWNTRSNWASGAANLITYTPTFDSTVQTEVQVTTANFPTCVIQRMTNDRFLVTSRGLSNDAAVDANNQLTQGSEIWLQSVLSPGVPTASTGGGNN